MASTAKFRRRELLRMGLGAAGMVSLTTLAGGCVSNNDSDTAGAPSSEPALAFPQPQVRRSVQGELDTTIEVRFARNDIGGFMINTRTYDGTVPGPTLRLQKGDRLKITWRNSLPPNHDAASMEEDSNIPHHPNTLNLHTHGLHVSPRGISDNIFLEFEPLDPTHGVTNNEYVSIIQLPDDHEEGTHWYHPHRHGSSAPQLFGGLAGVLIVEGPTNQVPEIAVARDIIMCIQDIRTDNNGEVPEFTNNLVYVNAPQKFFTVNGKLNPTLRLRPGEVQRWRLLHASARSNLDIVLEGHRLHQIAQDGITFNRPVARERIFFGAANRADVLVQAGGPGTYTLKTITDGTPLPTGSRTADLVTVIVEGEPVTMALPTVLPGSPSLVPITDAEIAASTAGPNGNGKRQIRFHTDPGGLPHSDFSLAERMTGTGETPPTNPPPGYDPEADPDTVPLPPPSDPTWGRFDPEFINHFCQLDTVEEWTIEGGDHPFHMHTNHFLVVAIDGVRLDPPVWYDTITTVGRKITIRFRDFTGDAVCHCHILDHEDIGMMQRVTFI